MHCWLQRNMRMEAVALLALLMALGSSPVPGIAEDARVIPAVAHEDGMAGGVVPVSAPNPFRSRSEPTPAKEVPVEAAPAEPAPAEPPAQPLKEVAPEPSPTPSAEISTAERISHLQRTIEKDKDQLDYLQGELRSAEEEFQLAGKIFAKVDERQHELRKQRDQAKRDSDPVKVAQLDAVWNDFREKYSLCKERFDLSIQTKKGVQQQITALKEKISQDTAALAKLSGTETEEPEKTEPASSEPQLLAPADGTPQPAAARSAAGTRQEPKPEAAQPAASPEPAQPTIAGGAIGAGVQGTSDEPAAATSGEMQQARSEASRKVAEANEAREALESIEKRQQLLDKNIALELELRDAARKQSDNAVRASQEMHEDFRKLSESNAPPEELTRIGQRIQSAELRLEKAREEVKRRSDRLDELQAQRHSLMLERIAAVEQAERHAQEAHEAKRKVEALENPFSQRNLIKWVMQHGPNIFVIVVGILMLRVVARAISHRVVTLMTLRGSGSHKERENRAKTIVGVFHNAATVVGYGGGALMILEECGVPVGPLLGGAAVVGLAVAFGSQNLIRDYFYGFVILLENQYGINDIVQIGGITGQVERITLRMTVIRDSEGVNFIPNGQIASVKNLTHGWSQVVMDIAVDFKEDVDRVMEVLLELGRELRKDVGFADKILADPTMQGVDALGDSAVTIKMSIKTRPFEQWSVKREMLRRVKLRFAERGILLPAGQRTVIHRYSKAEEDLNLADDDTHWNHRKSA